MTLSSGMFDGRIFPDELVKKSDAWCEGVMVGATEATLRRPPSRVKEKLKVRVKGMPYRSHVMHQHFVKIGHGVTPSNWMNGLAAKRLLKQIGY